MERRLSTTLMRMLDMDSQKAVSQYYECLLYDWRHQGDEVSQHRAWLIQGGRALSIPDRFWTNVCASCDRHGAIVPHHRQGPTIPIVAQCKQCDRYVCHDCMLKVPGSVPLRFREDTFCSYECWTSACAPKEEEELEKEAAS